jgi:hypothetical protein
MENTNKIKKIFIGLACLVVVVLIGLSMYQQQQLKRISQPVNVESAAVDEPASNTQSAQADNTKQYPDGNTPLIDAKAIQPETSDSKALEATLNATEKELDAAQKQLAEDAARKKELKEKELEMQRQYLKDPSYKNYLTTYIGTDFADLFKDLNLSPEEVDKLKDLMVDFLIAHSEINLDSASAYTDEEKAALRKRAEEAYNDNQSKLKDLLGSAAYQKYYDYYERNDARSTVKSYVDSLSMDDKLTKDLEKTLIEVIYKEQSRVFSEIGYDPNKSVEFESDIKSGKTDGKLKNMEKIFLGSIENSKGVLSVSQHEQFKNYLTNYIERLNMSYKAYNQ